MISLLINFVTLII